MTLIDLQGHFSFVLSENKFSLFFRSPVESVGDLTKEDIFDDLECPLKVISGQVGLL